MTDQEKWTDIGQSSYTVMSEEAPQIGDIVTEMGGLRVRVLEAPQKSTPGWQFIGEIVQG